MIDFSNYLIPDYLIILLFAEAITGCVLMIRAQHNLVLIPLACALSWMLIAYLFYLVGFIDIE